MGDYPWFPTYSNDWLGSNKITAMNIAEEGAYHRLLCCQWNEPDCTLPADTGELKVLARISGSILENHIDFSRIAKCFVAHPSKPNRVYNVRLMEEFKKMKRLRKEKSEAGKRGNAIRWGSHSDHKAIAEPIAKDRSSQSQSQSQKEEEKSMGLTPPPDKPLSFYREAEEVLTFLNEKVGRHYRVREANGRYTRNIEWIQARLRSGATIEQCRAVIAIKCRKWKDDPKMAEFLRPQTLFGKEKFEQYLGEVGT